MQQPPWVSLLFLGERKASKAVVKGIGGSFLSTGSEVLLLPSELSYFLLLPGRERGRSCSPSKIQESQGEKRCSQWDRQELSGISKRRGITRLKESKRWSQGNEASVRLTWREKGSTGTKRISGEIASLRQCDVCVCVCVLHMPLFSGCVWVCLQKLRSVGLESWCG